MSSDDDSDPRTWQIDAPSDCVDLYDELVDESRALTPEEAAKLVTLVDAWRALEHPKHIALMTALRHTP